VSKKVSPQEGLLIQQAQAVGGDRSSTNWNRLILGLFLGIVAGWYLSEWVHTASSSDFLDATQAGYFRTLSDWEEHLDRVDLTSPASSQDCRIVEADADVGQHGVAKFGQCHVETELGSIYYELALSGSAGFVWAQDNIDELNRAREKRP
jgi:hypothetical protein